MPASRTAGEKCGRGVEDFAGNCRRLDWAMLHQVIQQHRKKGHLLLFAKWERGTWLNRGLLCHFAKACPLH